MIWSSREGSRATKRLRLSASTPRLDCCFMAIAPTFFQRAESAASLTRASVFGYSPGGFVNNLRRISLENPRQPAGATFCRLQIGVVRQVAQFNHANCRTGSRAMTRVHASRFRPARRRGN